MTSIERTAYPRFKRSLTAKDLTEVYTPTPGERFLALRSTKGSVAELGFLVLLKTYQRLGRFIPLGEVPAPIIEHIAKLVQEKFVGSFHALLLIIKSVAYSGYTMRQQNAG